MLTNALNAASFYYEDVPENWHQIAGQRFRVGSRHVHVGGIFEGSPAHIVRGLCPINQNGTILHPAGAFDADTLQMLDSYGIAMEKTETGKYRAAVPLRFESYYRIVQGKAYKQQQYF